MNEGVSTSEPAGLSLLLHHLKTMSPDFEDAGATLNDLAQTEAGRAAIIRADGFSLLVSYLATPQFASEVQDWEIRTFLRIREIAASILLHIAKSDTGLRAIQAAGGLIAFLAFVEAPNSLHLQRGGMSVICSRSSEFSEPGAGWNSAVEVLGKLVALSEAEPSSLQPTFSLPWMRADRGRPAPESTTGAFF